MAKPIAIEHVFKVFGDAPQAALDLVRQGCSKQEILERTGQSIGVFDAHFHIEAGEIFVVMGLSGSGKSTLVRMLNRLIEPTAGRILVGGEDINQLSDRALRALRRKDISMVFQSFALLPHLTVLDTRPSAWSWRAWSAPSGSAWPPPRWSRSAWPAGARATPTSSRAACSSAWAWPARWRQTRRFC